MEFCAAAAPKPVVACVAAAPNPPLAVAAAPKGDGLLATAAKPLAPVAAAPNAVGVDAAAAAPKAEGAPKAGALVVVAAPNAEGAPNAGVLVVVAAPNAEGAPNAGELVVVAAPNAEGAPNAGALVVAAAPKPEDLPKPPDVAGAAPNAGALVAGAAPKLDVVAAPNALEAPNAGALCELVEVEAPNTGADAAAAAGLVDPNAPAPPLEAEFVELPKPKLPKPDDIPVVVVAAELADDPNVGFEGATSVAKLAELDAAVIPNLGAGDGVAAVKLSGFSGDALAALAGGVPGGGVAFARSSSSAACAAAYPLFALAKKSALKLMGGAATGVVASFDSSFFDSSSGTSFDLTSPAGFISAGFAPKLNAGALASSDFESAVAFAGVPKENPPAGFDAGALEPNPPLTGVAADVEVDVGALDGIPKLNFASDFFSSTFSPLSSSSSAVWAF